MAEKNDRFVNQIADINTDYTKWYTDVCLKSELCDYGPVKGTMVFRPYGYAIWERIQAEADKRFKAQGVENAYFPMLIPQTFLMREAEHVEGFAPEVATVTHVGDTELGEKLVLRPTSETIIGNMYSKWISSYRDLPLKLNQWANVVRWEKTTRPFLRTSEFLWQEGHTVFASAEEANADALTMLGVYKELANDVLCLPVLVGQKSEKEKFAGAVATYGMEAMMKDGKSLQAGTTHYLGENFAKAFDIKFLDKDGTHKYAYQASWGISTRLIGAIIMAHGDERGLCLPPPVAPVQVVIIPIGAVKNHAVADKAEAIKADLVKAGVRVTVDNRDQSPGFKFNHWELRGVPVRMELGGRDIEAGVVTVCRRDTAEKFTMPLDGVVNGATELLETIRKNMLDKAAKFTQDHIVKVNNLDEMGAALDGGNFTDAYWCGDRECEEKIKQTYSATSRVMHADQSGVEKHKCVCCGKKAKKRIYFARAY
ncbi:MAG: proline--tRNA ligase [Clostridiales bacterium]|nr:proline--tRNA ligase [Clostridiales bacterium]